MRAQLIIFQLSFSFIFFLCNLNCAQGHTFSPPSSVVSLAQGGGTDIGQGGEGALATWKSIALTISEDLRKLKVSSLDHTLFKKIQAALPQLILEARIEFKTYPLILGIERPNVDGDAANNTPISGSCSQSTRLMNERDAINFSRSKKIKVNLHRFLCYRTEGLEIQRLILHEYLGLLGITEIENNDVQYKITNALLQDFLSLPMIDKGLEVKIIRTCHELLQIGERTENDKKIREQSNLSATPRILWKLAKDIDCAVDSTKTLREIFQPKSLTWGSLDGAGFSIKNLTILSNENSVGGALFASLCSRCSIVNLSLENVKISGPATLVAENYGHISQVSVTGQLKSIFPNTGGLVAINYSGHIDHVAINLKITSKMKSNSLLDQVVVVGGLVGVNDQGKITQALVNTKINASNTIGGVVGIADWGSIIRNSTAFVSLSCNDTCLLGGFAGVNKGIIFDSRVSGKIKITPASKTNKSIVGGFLGVNFALDDTAKDSRDIQATLNSCISEVSICGSPQAGLAVGSSQVTKESGVEVLSTHLEGVEVKGSISTSCP